jgi:hypothetical protein
VHPFDRQYGAQILADIIDAQGLGVVWKQMEGCWPHPYWPLVNAFYTAWKMQELRTLCGMTPTYAAATRR